MRLLVWLVLLALASPCAASDLYRIWLDGDEESYARITETYRTVLSLKGKFADALLSEAEVATLRQRGYRIEFVQKDPEEFMRRMAAAPDRGEYRSYDEMLVEFRRLEKENPGLVRLKDFGDGWEKFAGLADRDLWAVGVFSGEAARRKAPAVLLMGGIHAREIATTEVLIDFIHQLVRGYRSDRVLRELLDSRQVWILPLLNPDGREYVMSTDPWWRKNRHKFGQSNSVGVDLNRNFPFYWSAGVGSSDNPSSAIYRGEAPLSEPETAGLSSFVTEVAPVASLSFHSYGGYVLTPYGYPGKHPEERQVYETISRELGEQTGYPAGTVGDLLGYFSSGRHDDWLYGMRRVLSFELEIGRTFFPEKRELESLSRLAARACLYLIRVSGSAPRAALKLAKRAKGPEKRGAEFLAERTIHAVLELSNTGLSDTGPTRWKLKTSALGVACAPDAGKLDNIPGLRHGSPAVEVPVDLHVDTRGSTSAGIEFELALELSGHEETLPVQLRAGPVLGE